MRIRDTLLSLLDSALTRPSRAKPATPSILDGPRETMAATAARAAQRQAEQAADEQRLAEMVTAFDKAAGRPGAAEALLSGAAVARADELSKVQRRTRTGTDTYCPHAKEVAQLREHGLPLASKLATLRSALGELSLERGTLPPLPTRPAAPAPAPAIQWSLPTLSELVDATFGKGVAASETRRPTYIDLAAREKHFEDCGEYERPARQKEWERICEKAEKAAQPAREKEDIAKLKTLLLSYGVRAPGLSYGGIRPPRPEGSERDRQQAQQNADAFVAVLLGDEMAQLAPGVGAASARRYLAECHGRRFEIGMTLPQTH